VILTGETPVLQFRQLLVRRFRRRQRDQSDAYDYQGRNISQQMPVLGGVLQCLHRHDAGVNQA
jgi:hypothetical protein